MKSFFVRRLGPSALLLSTLAVSLSARPSRAGAVPVAVHFAAEVNGAPFACGKTYKAVGKPAATWQPQDLRMYVSQVALVTAAGERLPLNLLADGTWQRDGVALLDFEDKTGLCKNGTREVNTSLRGTREDTRATVGLAFDIAVPFELNHADAAAAMPPLDQAGMFWSWQGGYKFLSVDGRINGKFGHSAHIGSTGCEMGAPNKVTACARPNHIHVELKAFDPAADEVVVDIGKLLAQSALGKSAHAGANGCMSEPDNDACVAVFEQAGIGAQWPQRFVSARRQAKKAP